MVVFTSRRRKIDFCKDFVPIENTRDRGVGLVKHFPSGGADSIKTFPRHTIYMIYYYQSLQLILYYYIEQLKTVVEFVLPRFFPRVDIYMNFIIAVGLRN